MRSVLERKNWKITACKIVVGSLAALVAFLAGERVCGGSSFHLYDACFYDLGYFLPFGLLEISVTLLAFSLLLSAFRDVFANLGRLTLGGRDIESVADIPSDE
ncbi:MAG: hypothetical protein K0U72_03065 [Gammaproteobacteria bacterium]|nr:hypothetical protein [Gammaproteobacteria bacterium]